jgi:cell division protein FtsZ
MNIKVLDVGGAGCNAINRMVEVGLDGVELIAANTDAQLLRRSHAHVCIQLGEALTHGLGAGGDPDRGRKSARQSQEELREVLRGADLVVVIAGLGGGTGTGAGPVIARLAKKSGALTVGIVTRPFEFEGQRRSSIAERGLQEMRKCVDTLLVIPAQRLTSKKTTHDQAFRLADDAILRVLRSISDIINFPGMIVLDIDDLRAIMKDAGEAFIGIGEASGPGRALRAAKLALASPLLEKAVMDGAKHLIVSIAGRRSTLSLSEVQKIMARIQLSVGADATLKMGNAFEESLGKTIRVTVIATRFMSRS